MTKQKTQAMKKLLLSLLLYATRSGGFANPPASNISIFNAKHLRNNL
jgi:hypothetical protein